MEFRRLDTRVCGFDLLSRASAALVMAFSHDSVNVFLRK